MNNQQQKKIPRTKHVRFAPLVTCADICFPSSAEVQHRWYNQSDLAEFKSEARNIIARGGGVHGSESIRGLEHCSEERRRHIYMSIRCTLSAHRHGLSVDQTAMESRKCTAWSGKIALVQACHDFAIVYQPSMASISIMTSLALGLDRVSIFST